MSPCSIEGTRIRVLQVGTTWKQGICTLRTHKLQSCAVDVDQVNSFHARADEPKVYHKVHIGTYLEVPEVIYLPNTVGTIPEGT